MKSGGPKMPSPEEMAKIQKERILDSAEYVKEKGAKVMPDGQIVVSGSREDAAKIMMGDHFYKAYEKLKRETTKTPFYNVNGRVVGEIALSLFKEAKDIHKEMKDLDAVERGEVDFEQIAVNFDNWLSSFKTAEHFLEEAERRLEIDNEMDEEKKARIKGYIDEVYAKIEKDKLEKK